jgi:hypothetical protein
MPEAVSYYARSQPAPSVAELPAIGSVSMQFPVG